MVVLKCIGGAFAGAIAGFLLAMVLFVPACAVIGISTGSQRRGEDLANTVLGTLPLIGALIGIAIPIVGYQLELGEARAQREAAAAAEAAARVAEEQRRREELQRALLGLRALCSEAQDAALSLPIVLAGGNTDLDVAERELDEGRYSPFWEAMEGATQTLNLFGQRVNLIEDRRTKHVEQSLTVGGLAPAFALGIDVLPDPVAIHRRLTTLYRRAQTDPNFANIYEQRRIASKVDRTNAILIAGFSSLGQAIERMGDRTEEAIESLGRNLDCRLGSIESALECAAAAAAEQHGALTAEVARAGNSGEQVAKQLRHDADNRAEHERMSRRMLDNIQRRRKPTIFDTPQ